MLHRQSHKTRNYFKSLIGWKYIMDKIYEGKKENGTWEEFGWDRADEPTPESTGYEEVRAKN